MGQRLSKVGSTKRKSILESWKTGDNSTWELKVDAVQVNKELMKVKRKNKIQLASEDTKQLKLEKEVQISKEAVKKYWDGKRYRMNLLQPRMNYKDSLESEWSIEQKIVICSDFSR